MQDDIVRLPEKFDFSYHEEFTREYKHILATNTSQKLTFDFSRVSYLDSSALGLLVLAHKQAQKEGFKTSIINARGSALDILKIANFQKLYSFE